MKPCKESARQLAFARLYLSEQIDGKPNPTYLNATRSALQAGYSPSYADHILQRIQDSKSSVVREKVGKVREGLVQALKDKGIDADWIIDRVASLGDSKKQGLYRGKFIDSKYLDSFAVKTALEFIAKTQGLYYADEQHPNDPYGLAERTDEDLDSELAGIITAISKGVANPKRESKTSGKQ